MAMQRYHAGASENHCHDHALRPVHPQHLKKRPESKRFRPSGVTRDQARSGVIRICNAAAICHTAGWTPTGNLAAIKRHAVSIHELAVAKRRRLPFALAQAYFDDLLIHGKFFIRQRASLQHQTYSLAQIVGI
jgi:hypothetical protein